MPITDEECLREYSQVTVPPIRNYFGDGPRPQIPHTYPSESTPWSSSFAPTTMSPSSDVRHVPESGGGGDVCIWLTKMMRKSPRARGGYLQAMTTEYERHGGMAVRRGLRMRSMGGDLCNGVHDILQQHCIYSPRNRPGHTRVRPIYYAPRSYCPSLYRSARPFQDAP